MRSNLGFVCAVLNLLASFVLLITPVVSQTQNKIIVWSKSPIGSNNERVKANVQVFRQIDGVEIEDIVVEGRSITLGKPFPANDDWLKSLTVRVRNISNQWLERIQITLVLPEMSNASPDVPFCYGCEPTERAKGVSAGQVVELKLIGGGFYDWLTHRMAENRVSTITKAEIHHMYVNVRSSPMWFSRCVKTAKLKNACPGGAR